MTFQIFIIIFTICAAITSIFTEALKKTFNKSGNKSDNIIALICSILVGCGTVIGYYLFKEIPFTAVNIAYIVVMGLLNWAGAMVGYDKVKQTLEQLFGPKEVEASKDENGGDKNE